MNTHLEERLRELHLNGILWDDERTSLLFYVGPHVYRATTPAEIDAALRFAIWEMSPTIKPNCFEHRTTLILFALGFPHKLAYWVSPDEELDLYHNDFEIAVIYRQVWHTMNNPAEPLEPFLTSCFKRFDSWVRENYDIDLLEFTFQYAGDGSLLAVKAPVVLPET